MPNILSWDGTLPDARFPFTVIGRRKWRPGAVTYVVDQDGFKLGMAECIGSKSGWANGRPVRETQFRVLEPVFGAEARVDSGDCEAVRVRRKRSEVRGSDQ